eukprot:5123830-Prymnesium_polylepis.1
MFLRATLSLSVSLRLLPTLEPDQNRRALMQEREKENVEARGRLDFTVQSKSGNKLSCVLTESPPKPVTESPVKGT